MSSLSTEALAGLIVGSVVCATVLFLILARLLHGCLAARRRRTHALAHDAADLALNARKSVSLVLTTNAFDGKDEILRSPMMGVEQELAHEALCVIKTLAEGDFWKVSQGEASALIQPDICTTVLIKTLHGTAPPPARQQFISEMGVLCRLDHPNLLPMLAMCSESDPLTMVFEHSDIGTLKNYLLVAGQVRESGADTSFSMLRTIDLTGMALDVASAVEFLHSKNILHTDISTRHCWVTTGGVVKLAPFQHLVPADHAEDYAVISDYPNFEGFRSAQMLPVRWMSPECLQVSSFSKASDIWSLGVTIWEIFAMGELPYSTYSNKTVITRVPTEGSWLDQPDTCPREMWQAVQRCLEINVSKRVAASPLLEQLRQLHASVRRNNMLVDLATVGGSSQAASMEKLT